MQRLGFAVFTLASVTLFLALAVWAEGGLSAFMAYPSLIALALATYGFGILATFTVGSLSRGEREDKANRWVIVAFTLIGLADGFLPAWTDRRGLWTIDGEAVRWVGFALFCLGCVLRIAPVFVLKNRFSGLVAIQPGHQLETGGLYAIVRNPSYVGLLITTLGWGLAFRAWAGVILTLLTIPVLVSRMDSEERLLASQFGEAYEAYRARTWRLIPWVY
ncbi:MAG TPA: isoprenylcysteine carboxylmethyltransferase family protein [Caulobacteraceae bacterium]